MTLSLMVYALLVSATLAAGAALAERLVRSSVPWTRFVWATALAVSVVLLAAAPGRAKPSQATAPGDAGTPATGVSVALDLPMSFASRSANALPRWSSRSLAALWLGSSLVTVMFLCASYRRHRRRIAHGTPAIVDGTAVRVTESLGPAVVGVRRPEIVVPRWLLSRGLTEQALVVRHERSHVEAGDPALLLAACAAAAAVPWNPIGWYMVARLRLAIEMDCDRRLLRAGAPARDYGSLLIELTSVLEQPAARLGAPAFASRPSHLERRLVAMTARPVSHRRTRLFAAASVAALAFVAACEAALPTAAEVEQMDAADVEERVLPNLKLDPASASYFVDGIAVDRSVAMGIAAERITGVEIDRTTPNGRIHFFTVDDKNAKERELRADASQKVPFILRRDGAPLAAGTLSALEIEGASSPKQALTKPLMIVDGVLMGPDDFGKLRAEEIAEVEVHKGKTAERLYGAKAASGVVTVTTKKAAPPQLTVLDKPSEVERRKVPYVESPKRSEAERKQVQGVELKKP